VCIVFVCLFFTASATISYYVFCVSQDVLECCRNPVFKRFFQCGVSLFCFALFFFSLTYKFTGFALLKLWHLR